MELEIVSAKLLIKTKKTTVAEINWNRQALIDK